jgi:hypothetical protein
VIRKVQIIHHPLVSSWCKDRWHHGDTQEVTNGVFIHLCGNSFMFIFLFHLCIKQMTHFNNSFCFSNLDIPSAQVPNKKITILCWQSDSSSKNTCLGSVKPWVQTPVSHKHKKKISKKVNSQKPGENYSRKKSKRRIFVLFFVLVRLRFEVKSSCLQCRQEWLCNDQWIPREYR